MLEKLLTERQRLLLEKKKIEASVYNNVHAKRRTRNLNARITEIEGRITEVLDNELK